MFRNVSLGLLVAATALGALSACSSMQDKSAVATPQSSKVVGMQENAQYVARVEQLARDRGIMVRWVNPPQKHPLPQSN